MHPTILYYGMDGQPISREEYARLYEGGNDERVVARTDLPNGYVVSTILLCLDHNWGTHGRPLIFETMVFDPSGSEADVPECARVLGTGGFRTCERYATAEEARAGHRYFVAEWAPLPDPRKGKGVPSDARRDGQQAR